MKTITNFWNHFQQNNFVFLLLNEISKDELKTHFDKLLEILHQYNKDLDLIIKNKTKGGELIITANGNPYLFKEVELLVHHAPVVERWKITAFLQPETNLSKYENGTDKPLEYYGITLRISEMYFIPLENPNKPTDLGTENNLKYFGNECNVMAEILLSRYDIFISKKLLTHITTNLSATEIEQHYGNRVRSRLREMVNLIAYDKSTPDKR